jgi:hypothetical protein
MKRPPGTCIFEHRHSQSTSSLFLKSSRNDSHLISCSISYFKQKLQTVILADYKMPRTTTEFAVYYYDAKIIHKNILDGYERHCCVESPTSLPVLIFDIIMIMVPPKKPTLVQFLAAEMYIR